MSSQPYVSEKYARLIAVVHGQHVADPSFHERYGVTDETCPECREFRRLVQENRLPKARP